MHPVRPERGRGQDVDLSTGHRRCRGSTCGYQAGIPIGILHPQQRLMPRGLLPTDGGSRYIGHRFADDRCLWSEHPQGVPASASSQGQLLLYHSNEIPLLGLGRWGKGDNYSHCRTFVYLCLSKGLCVRRDTSTGTKLQLSDKSYEPYT